MQNFDRYDIFSRQKFNNNSLLNTRVHLLLRHDAANSNLLWPVEPIYSPPLYIPTQHISRCHVTQFT